MKVTSGSGDGSGYGSGDGYGDGYDYGSGDGSGSGDGYGDGYDYGSGDGSGSGSGYGSGDGSGDGSGYGDEFIKSINGESLYMIDGIPTLIDHIHGFAAKARIFNSDLTTTPCYVVKRGDYFAHGDTLRKAVEAANAKLFEYMPEEDRIAAFVAAHDRDKLYAAIDFFEWHNKLTGSCEAGRKAFVRNHNYSMEKEYSVAEFIAMTENDYGGNVIAKLKKFYT